MCRINLRLLTYLRTYACYSAGRREWRVDISGRRRASQVYPAAEGHWRHRGWTGEVWVPSYWTTNTDHQVVQRS